MRFLRTTSTRRLLAAIAGLLVAAIAGTAIAIAAVGSGPVPAKKPLATAIHAALVAPSVSGITARVTFTNHLIDSSDIQGIDPLFTGGSGRLWLSPTEGLRLELQSDNGDAQIVVHKNTFWAYDPASNTVYEGTLPAGLFSGSGATSHRGAGQEKLPSIAQIQSAIAKLAGHLSISSAIPGDVAGQPTYTVRVSPKADAGLLGGASLAWDAVHGVPLRFAVFAKGDSSPVLELKATNISYGRVSSGVFNITPPSGAHVVHFTLPAAIGSGKASHSKHAAKGAHKDSAVTGAGAVASHVGFTLDAPVSLAGFSRSSVTLLGHGAHAGALVAYGHGLNGVYVIERPAAASAAQGLSSNQAGGSDGGPGLSLPSVSVNGASAQELDTALGTVIQFTRQGVSYTVLGSVDKATAERAARSL
jgi:outer membrane lipoprotein-sorting protein